jgi:cell division initiation protein
MLMNHATDASSSAEPRRLPGPDRTHSVTPLDVRQAKFGSAMRGFDRAEVTAFLLEAADGYESALRENERLRQELVRLEASLHQYRELESSLKGAVMNAQKLGDDMRENASQESARMRDQAAQEAVRIIREAEGRAELIMDRAQAAIEDVQREIDGLKLKRREAQSGLESIISALHNTLDFVREQEEREHRIVPHRPRLDVAQSA